ncbi:DNA polymerase III subunit gamma/tau [Actinomyces minihominis]|uniref:DNA polymerase III subunit gamma/tau n=1 Tax=Actinomyces minihominis TaxID=2002838 RepID=UPI000C070908|nr:DNA polymerase III subunit gamma/tau [Actinomyces minihominis]
MSTALYRRYRPDTFQDVIGQEHVTDALKAALDGNRVTHAYLFSGPRGCGKTTSARILARSLNCIEGPTSQPCGVCDSCVELAAGGPGSLDVVEIDAASNNGVEHARALREKAEFAPTRDRYRIFILDEAHMVTASGFNALLKLVEEPPDHTKFIFATTEPEKVISTIRSRTHHYPFRLVAPAVLVPYLKDLAVKEGVEVEEGVYPLIVRSGGGSVRDSLSVMDQLMAGSNGTVTVQSALDLLGYTDAAILERTVDALGDLDGAEVFAIVEEVTDKGQEPRRFVEDLLQRLRDLLVCALIGERAADTLIEIPADQLAVMHTQAGKWGARLLSQRADIIEGALREMVGATSPRLQLELLMARLLVVDGSTQGATQTVSAPAPATAVPPRQAPRGPQTAAPAARPAPQASPAAPTSSTEVPRVPRAGTTPTPAATSVPTRPSQVAQQPLAATTPAASDTVADSAFMRAHWATITKRMGEMGSAYPSLMKNVRGSEAAGSIAHVFFLQPSNVAQFKRFGGEDKMAGVFSEILGRSITVIAEWEGDRDKVVAKLKEGGVPAASPEVAAEPAPRAEPEVEKPAPQRPVQQPPESHPKAQPEPEQPTPVQKAPEVQPVAAPKPPIQRPEPPAEPAAMQAPPVPADPDGAYRGRPLVDVFLDIVGGTVIEEKLISTIEPEGDVLGDDGFPEPIEPDENALSGFDLGGHE